MFDLIYVEEAVRDHPAARRIRARFPRAAVVACSRFGEIFNRRGQNFRLQKKRPALILAEKHGNLVLEAPEGYGIGHRRNFYFSHLLNCPYDCRYCFLQGMYRSAHWVLFVNYQDFQEAIARKIDEEAGTLCFFTGYDCDSLALEPLSGFASAFLPFIESAGRATFEFRTKSVRIRPLLERPPLENCVVAFSFTPPAASRALEHGVPPIFRRLEAMARLEERGWRLGLRFDPLIYHQGFEDSYRAFFREVFGRIRPERLHSVSLGAFRLPVEMYGEMERLYPEEKLFAFGLRERQG